MTIASLELDNLNLFEINDEESAAVNGGVAAAVAGALVVSYEVAARGLADPNSNSRDILREQLNRLGFGALGGALTYIAPAIVAGGPISVGAASLGKSK